MTNEEAVTIILKEIAYIKSSVYSDDLKVTAWVEGRISALKLALVALEKQIPKKPIPVETSDNEFICYVCPFCKNVEVKNFGVEYTDCCGQALDWSEE